MYSLTQSLALLQGSQELFISICKSKLNAKPQEWYTIKFHLEQTPPSEFWFQPKQSEKIPTVHSIRMRTRSSYSSSPVQEFETSKLRLSSQNKFNTGNTVRTASSLSGKICTGTQTRFQVICTIILLSATFFNLF